MLLYMNTFNLFCAHFYVHLYAGIVVCSCTMYYSLYSACVDTYEHTHVFMSSDLKVLVGDLHKSGHCMYI